MHFSRERRVFIFHVLMFIFRPMFMLIGLCLVLVVRSFRRPVAVWPIEYMPLISMSTSFITAHSELHKVLFLAPWVCGFLFVYEISHEPLNGFAPNSQGDRVCLVPCSDEFEGRGQRSKVKVTRDKTAFSVLSAACVRFMFGKTSLAFSFSDFYIRV